MKPLGYTEAVVRSWSVKNVFWKISQNSQENTCVGVSFVIKLLVAIPTQVFSCEFSEIFKKTLYYRTPPVVASW